MFGLFKKPKNPTLAWDPVHTTHLHLNVDTKQINGVAIGCEASDLEVFGNSARFEPIDKTGFVLSYLKSGFALVIENTKLTNIDIYLVEDPDDAMQLCGELVVTLGGRDLCLSQETGHDKIKATWGKPDEEDVDSNRNVSSLAWNRDGHTLLLAFDKNKLENVELHGAE